MLYPITGSRHAEQLERTDLRAEEYGQVWSVRAHVEVCAGGVGALPKVLDPIDGDLRVVDTSRVSGVLAP